MVGNCQPDKLFMYIVQIRDKEKIKTELKKKSRKAFVSNTSKSITRCFREEGKKKCENKYYRNVFNTPHTK